MEYHIRIKAARKQKGFTQIQMAELLNIKQSSYSKYESGKRRMPLNRLIAFCKITNVSANYILGLVDDINYPIK
ncbi:MAG: helix-turn-helix domain-containing protein [Eubacterium sp.]|nr:helix-turn-helix domain-containing protein [Eubacterium sp.]